MSSTPNPPADIPRLRRSLTLGDLILYGIVVIQPVAPMSVYGVLSDRGHGHVVTTILIAMVAMLFTAIIAIRSAQRPRTWPCSYNDPDRDGGDAVHRHQLWPHGASLSQRRLGLHLCRPGNQSRAWLRNGRGHGGGLKLQPD